MRSSNRVTGAYRAVAPDPVRRGVHNFLNNLRTPVILANDLLQGEFRRAGITLTRFVINSTVGVLGFSEQAAGMGFEIPQRRLWPDPGGMGCIRRAIRDASDIGAVEPAGCCRIRGRFLFRSNQLLGQQHGPSSTSPLPEPSYVKLIRATNCGISSTTLSDHRSIFTRRSGASTVKDGQTKSIMAELPRNSPHQDLVVNFEIATPGLSLEKDPRK